MLRNLRTKLSVCCERQAIGVGVAGLAILVLLTAVQLTDRYKIKEEVRPYIGDGYTDKATVLGAMSYMYDNVPYDYGTKPFSLLDLPITRPLRPTALQVMHYGGKCSYRARAFVVILDAFGVKAEKRILCNEDGEPFHVVAVAHTDKGDYVVDLMFDILYDNDDGSPIPIDQITTDVITREKNEAINIYRSQHAADYEVEKWHFANHQSFDWTKPGFRHIKPALDLVLAPETIKNMHRSVVFEEPAALAGAIVSAINLALIVALFALSRVLAWRPRSVIDDQEQDLPESCNAEAADYDAGVFRNSCDDDAVLVCGPCEEPSRIFGPVQTDGQGPYRGRVQPPGSGLPYNR